MRRRDFIAMAGAAAVLPMAARAVTYPLRPIKLVIGFPAGGPLDVVSRIIAQGLSTRLGQPVVVENRPGATGTVAAGQVARAEPDGYTLMVIPATYAASAALFRKLSYRPVEDFSEVSMTAEFPYILVTYSDHPIRTIANLIGAAQTGSTPLTFGTSGIGSVQHLAMELFANRANIKLQHVPFRGGAPAITELLGRRIDFVLDQPTALIDLIKDGRFRALAVTSGSRSSNLPDTLTISETGIPGYAVTGWQGLIAPAGLPEPVLSRLHAALTGVLAEPNVVGQLRTLGNDPRPSTPEEFKARLVAEIKTWTEVVVAANIERI